MACWQAPRWKKGLRSSQPTLASFLRAEGWDILTLANFMYFSLKKLLSMPADQNETREIQTSVIHTS